TEHEPSACNACGRYCSHFGSMMMLIGLAEFIGEMFVSLLPPRYRNRFTGRTEYAIRHPAWVSGIAQILFSVFFLVHRLLNMMRPGQDSVASAIVGTVFKGHSGPQAMFGAAIFGLADFAFQPANLFAVYMVVEGVVRTLAAGCIHHTIGSLP